MRILPILSLLLLSAVQHVAIAAGDDPGRTLPARSCGAGWPLDGTVAVYDRETLSDRIDGEAEIFFPYGFESLAYGRYIKGKLAFDVDVYRMGSLLDAFGMYAGYRPDGAEPVRAGVEGAVTASQLFFYQDRYFVRLQSTGEGDAGEGALAACAEAVSRLLPAGQGAPREIGLLAIREVEKGSVRYSATSLLGYDFFPRGLTADAVIGGEPARVFVVLARTEPDATDILKRYRAYLSESGGSAKSSGAALTGVDPLYGNAVAGQVGRYVFGMVRVKDVAAALPVMEKLRQRLGK